MNLVLGLPWQRGAPSSKVGVWASLVNTVGPACIPALVRQGAWEGKVKRAGGCLPGRRAAIRNTSRFLRGCADQVAAMEPKVTDPWEVSARTHDLVTEDGVWFLGASVQKCGSHRVASMVLFHGVRMRPDPRLALCAHEDGAARLSQFPPGTPAVSVSRGSLSSPSLLESGSLMDCTVGQTLQILQQCLRGPQTYTHRCLGDVLNVRIRILYRVRENVRESEYSTLEKKSEDRSHVARISSLHQPKCTGEKTKGKSGAAGVFITFVQIQFVLHNCFSFQSVCPRSWMNGETKP